LHHPDFSSVFLGILKRYPLWREGLRDTMDGSTTTRATKHGICRDTRCIIQFSFVFFVSVLSLSSTLRCLCSFASFSTLHWPLPTLPLHQPALVFFHIPCSGAFSFPFCYLLLLAWNGTERNPQRYQDVLPSTSHLPTRPWVAGSHVGGPSNWESAPFLTTGRAGLPTRRGVDQDGWAGGRAGMQQGETNCLLACRLLSPLFVQPWLFSLLLFASFTSFFVRFA
jgi:hypothetical protein